MAETAILQALPETDSLFHQTLIELNRQLRRTDCGRAKHPSPLERFSLSVAGRLDGVRSQLREGEKGIWTSPLIQKESDALEAQCSRTWGMVLSCLEPYRQRESQLRIAIGQLESVRDHARSADTLMEETDLMVRKRGEELLTEAQVRACWQRERLRAETALRIQEEAITTRLVDILLELARIHSIITDAESRARMSCERVMNHTKDLS